MSLLLAEREAPQANHRLNASTVAVLRAGRRHIARSMLHTGALMLAVAMLVGLLTACGGGDPEDNPLPEADAAAGKTTQPLNCALHPEKCK